MKDLIVGWFATLGVGLATGIVAAVLGGFLAALAVDWYQVSSREGASGYAVVAQGLLAGVIGILIGVIASRVVASAGGTQIKGLMIAQAIALTALAVVYGTARLLADVPPTFQGDRLLLAVEVSWPEASAPQLPSGPDVPFVELASVSGGTSRGARTGPLWIADMRRENGRVIVPSAVEIWTERGKRVFSVNTGTKDSSDGILLPIPSRPGSAQREWSEWMPRARSGSAPLADGIRYRFRIVKRTEPIRWTTVGPFQIGTVVRQFLSSQFVSDHAHEESNGSFIVKHAQQPVVLAVRAIDVFQQDQWSPKPVPPADSMLSYAAITSVRVMPAAQPTLIVTAERRDDNFRYVDLFLLQSQGDRVNVTHIGADVVQPPAFLLRASTATRTEGSADASAEHVDHSQSGIIDTLTFRVPGLYLFQSAILDSRTGELRRTPWTAPGNDGSSFSAPLSLAPDESHFARLLHRDTSRVIEVVSVKTSAKYEVPVGSLTTQTGSWDDANRAWFDHYFAWTADAAQSYRVVRLANAEPLPYQGRFSEQADYREYRLSPVDAEFREVILDALAAELRAVRVPAEPDAFSKNLIFESDTVHFNYSDRELVVWMSRGERTLPMVKIARSIDKALATHRYDKHFLASTPE